MKAWQTSCIVGAIACAGVYLASGRPAATVPDALPQAAANVPAPANVVTPASVVTPDLYAEASARLAAALRSQPGLVMSSDPGPLKAAAEIADIPAGIKLASLGEDITLSLPPARDAAGDTPKAAASPTQDFRYLINYVYSEVPPAEKPAETVLRAFKDIPLGTPVEEIKRAADAFGLDANFMKAVAKIESGFNPTQRTGSYIGLFQLSKYEFGKFGSGNILNPRDNAVAAAYKMITEGILFQWITHRKPDLSDLYLIHQQGWEGAAEHISQPGRLAWKSMCATGEGREKGEKWCRRAIWGNTLPVLKKTWKSVENVTSEAFVGMWRSRVAEFYTKYMAVAAQAPTP